MNFGNCPYEDCDGTLWLELPDRPLPCMCKHVCETCGRDVWYKLSRVDPEAFTVEEFDKTFVVANGKIEKRSDYSA